MHYLIPVFFVTIWLGMIYLTAQISGWSRLASKYRCGSSFVGSCKSWQWGRIGRADYKGCLWIAVAPEGLFMKTGPLFVFRLGHPPLLIPWRAIKSVEETKYWWKRVWKIDLNDSDVPIMVAFGALDDGRRFLGDKLKPLPGQPAK